MRVLPNMKILVPADSNQTRASVLASIEAEGPVYIRFGRNPVPQLYTSDEKVKISINPNVGVDALPDFSTLLNESVHE